MDIDIVRNATLTSPCIWPADTASKQICNAVWSYHCDHMLVILKQKSRKVFNRNDLTKQSYLQWVSVWTFMLLTLNVQNVRPVDLYKDQLFFWHIPPYFSRPPNSCLLRSALQWVLTLLEWRVGSKYVCKRREINREIVRWVRSTMVILVTINQSVTKLLTQEMEENKARLHDSWHHPAETSIDVW